MNSRGGRPLPASSNANVTPSRFNFIMTPPETLKGDGNLGPCLSDCQEGYPVVKDSDDVEHTATDCQDVSRPAGSNTPAFVWSSLVQIRGPQPLADKQVTGVPVRRHGLKLVFQSRSCFRQVLQQRRQSGANDCTS